MKTQTFKVTIKSKIGGLTCFDVERALQFALPSESDVKDVDVQEGE